MSSRLGALAALPYLPVVPSDYSPQIGLIGCGGISKYHLRAYSNGGLKVKAVCDLNLEAAKARAQEFYPDATIYEDYQELLRDDTIEVVDITTHPPERPAIIKDALNTGKHVLSQKPFVLDLDEGLRLADLADKVDRQLAVNQNGRWAPHFSFARAVAERECIGKVFAAHLSCHWDHTWVAGTEFEKVKHLILYDYGIHWFDIVLCFLSSRPTRVFASTSRVPGQTLMPDMLGQALIEFEEGQATLAFDGALPSGPHDRTFLSGTAGSLISSGPEIQDQCVKVATDEGTWSPKLSGQWFPDGFLGTMGELLTAIAEGRESTINARDNLDSLALCFAAVQSAETGQAVAPGSVRKLPA